MGLGVGVGVGAEAGVGQHEGDGAARHLARAADASALAPPWFALLLLLLLPPRLSWKTVVELGALAGAAPKPMSRWSVSCALSLAGGSSPG